MTEIQLVGVDIGTTGVKSVLLDTAGRILAEATVAHDLHSPDVGWAEEDPADWISGAFGSLRAITGNPSFQPAKLAGIGVSGMVPAMVLLDEAGQPVRPSIQQNDARAYREAAELSVQLDQDRLFARTGGFTNLQHIAPRLRWVQRHEPDVWRQTKTITGSYDLVTAFLTGGPPSACSLELNWAIESGLFDLITNSWATDLLEAVDLETTYFPSVHKPSDIVGTVSQKVAAETGVPAETPVVAGSADHVASALAAGLREDGDTLIKFGGAGDILYCSSTLVTHPRLFIDAHDIPGMFLLNGCMAASGSLVKWLVSDILGKEPNRATLTELDNAASAIPAGSEGVVILPYFLGEKTPILDPHARGVIFGLDLSHGPAHLFRAVLEAVIFGFRHHVDVLSEAGHRPKRYLATNGGVSSPIWRQIAADALGAEITSFPGHTGSSLGVAFVAGMATGAFSAWSEIDRFLQQRVINAPADGNRDVYDARYATYRELYDALYHLFPRS